MTKEELLAAVLLAESYHVDDDAPPVLAQISSAVVSLWAATKHYEDCITWETNCQTCSGLLDQLQASEVRADEAEAALTAALARRSR